MGWLRIAKAGQGGAAAPEGATLGAGGGDPRRRPRGRAGLQLRSCPGAGEAGDSAAAQEGRDLSVRLGLGKQRQEHARPGRGTLSSAPPGGEDWVGTEHGADPR